MKVTKIKKVKTSNGRTLYFMAGKMKSEREVPLEALKLLEQADEIDFEIIVPPRDLTKCIFDEDEATHKKFLLGENVGLCDEHFTYKTTGEVAERMRDAS